MLYNFRVMAWCCYNLKPSFQTIISNNIMEEIESLMNISDERATLKPIVKFQKLDHPGLSKSHVWLIHHWGPLQFCYIIWIMVYMQTKLNNQIDHTNIFLVFLSRYLSYYHCHYHNHYHLYVINPNLCVCLSVTKLLLDHSADLVHIYGKIYMV